MDDAMRQKIALFKFSVIAPLVNDTFEAPSKEAFYRHLAGKEYNLPDGRQVQFASDTIKSWFLSYMRNGMDALMPKIRNDMGRSRALTDLAINQIHEIKEKYPYITGTLVYQKLIEQGYIKASKISLSTVLRYIKANGLQRQQLAPEDRRAFELEHANDCWQADTSHGPVISVSKRKRQTYITAFIDDASRLITHAECYYNDNSVNMQDAFKKAVYKYGVPKRLYVDNGSPYKNGQLSMICASLGVALIHTPPYSPQNKGKIERSFRTLKDCWLNGVDWNDFHDLKALNDQFFAYINEEYNNHYHKVINSTPKERWFVDSSLIKYLPEETIEDCFLHRIERKVANDATISINKKVFEVPPEYIGQKISLRYMPCNDLSVAYIFNNKNKVAHTIYPLKRVDNSKVKRNKKISVDYSLATGGETDV